MSYVITPVLNLYSKLTWLFASEGLTGRHIMCHSVQPCFSGTLSHTAREMSWNFFTFNKKTHNNANMLLEECEQDSEQLPHFSPWPFIVLLHTGSQPAIILLHMGSWPVTFVPHTGSWSYDSAASHWVMTSYSIASQWVQPDIVLPHIGSWPVKVLPHLVSCHVIIILSHNGSC